MRKDKTSDWIHLHGLRLKCHIGISSRERQNKQTIIADIALQCNLRRAGRSDCLKDTIDYAGIVKALAEMTGKKSFCLLESLAENIVRICLVNQKAVEVIVKINKSGFQPNISSAGVEIRRVRTG